MAMMGRDVFLPVSLETKPPKEAVIISVPFDLGLCSHVTLSCNLRQGQDVNIHVCCRMFFMEALQDFANFCIASFAILFVFYFTCASGFKQRPLKHVTVFGVVVILLRIRRIMRSAHTGLALLTLLRD